jgi:hypothetical protein
MSNHAHVLLARGVLGLARLMRRLLTGYAVSYNLRHRRHGHLFQNRDKSIVCDGDTYFMELVRCIHLNPLIVKLVKDMDGLESYPYCGRGVILLDFTLGTHPITTKGTTEVGGGAKRRRGLG